MVTVCHETPTPFWGSSSAVCPFSDMQAYAPTGYNLFFPFKVKRYRVI